MSDYFKIEALSYSALRNLSISPAYFKYEQQKESEEKEHFIIGSGVDILLTEANKFWDYFALEFQETCDKIPTGQMKEFSETLFKLDKELDDAVEAEKKAYESIGFKRKSDNFGAIITKYTNECLEYDSWLENKYQYELKNKDKQILTKAQYQLITDIGQSLNSNKFTRKYFENSTGKNIEVFNQLEIYWEFKDEKCKSKLDKVIVNHENKTIQPIDLKTTGGGVYAFNTSCLKYRYDLQAAYYSSALYWLINKSNDQYWTKYKNYKILSFKFIVESTKTPGFPLVFRCSEQFLNGGISGFKKDGKFYKGFIELIHDYKWYRDNNSWTYNKEIIENNGEIELIYD